MRYNIKLLYSPIKWLCCFLFVAIIPIAMYVPSYFDFVNVSTMYLPFIGVVLFTDLMLIDRDNQIEEISFISNKSPIKTFIQRLLIIVVLLVAYMLLANGIFRLFQFINGAYAKEPISFIEYIVITGGGCLFIGMISMTISTILNNPYVGYGFSLVFWMYWNINSQKEAIINPFPFIANPTFYEKPLLIIYIFAGFLILLNCYLANKSPFFLSDKARKILYR